MGDCGSVNWRFDAGRLVQEGADVLAKAQEFIGSRLEIPGMDNARGIVEANYGTGADLSQLTGAPGAI